MKTIVVAILVFSGVGLLWAAPSQLSGEGRLSGTVVNDLGEKIEGVAAILTSPDLPKLKLESTSGSAGQLHILVLDASKKYNIHLEKSGYVPLDQPVEFQSGETVRVSFTLNAVK